MKNGIVLNLLKTEKQRSGAARKEIDKRVRCTDYFWIDLDIHQSSALSPLLFIIMIINGVFASELGKNHQSQCYWQTILCFLTHGQRSSWKTWTEIRLKDMDRDQVERHGQRSGWKAWTEIRLKDMDRDQVERQGPKTIKKSTNSTPNISQTQRMVLTWNSKLTVRTRDWQEVGAFYTSGEKRNQIRDAIKCGKRTAGKGDSAIQCYMQ